MWTPTSQAAIFCGTAPPFCFVLPDFSRRRARFPFFLGNIWEGEVCACAWANKLEKASREIHRREGERERGRAHTSFPRGTFGPGRQQGQRQTTMSLNSVQGQQGAKDGERARLFPAPVTGYSNGQSPAPSADVEQPSRCVRSLWRPQRIQSAGSLERSPSLWAAVLDPSSCVSSSCA